MSSMPALCAEQLSIRSRTFHPVMRVENQHSHSAKSVAFIHTLVFALYSQPSELISTFLKQQGRAYFPIIHIGSFSEPLAFAHAMTVRCCLSSFFPSSCFVARKRLVCMQKNR